MTRQCAGAAAALFILFVFAAPAVSQTISYSSLAAEVGSGLQTSTARARLSDDQHGGITVRIESADTTLALISAGELIPGSSFIDVFVANGSTDANFYVQALEDTTGTATIIATAPGFTNGVDSIDVVVPSLRVSSLGTSHDPFDLDDPFLVAVGIANGSNTALSPTQKVRVGGPGLTATISNSNASVGQIVTTAVTGQVATVTIAPGDANAPTTVATGGVAFDGLAAGTSDVEVTIPGFGQLNNNPLTVTVTTPVITMTTFPRTVGAGLQAGSQQARLSGSQHGGTTIHLESSDSSLVLLATGQYDAGSRTLDIFVPNGSVTASFFVQALEDTTGAAIVAATATAFNPGVGPVTVAQPYFRLNGLSTSIDTLDPNDSFWVSVGLPNGTFSSLSPVQQARGGGAGLTFSVTSSVDTVGLLEKTALLDDTVTVFIPAGLSNSPTTVANGGVAFDGVGAGVTTVTAAATGFLPVSNGIVNVTVTQPTVSITNKPSIGVGAGLQPTNTMRALLSASQHGGVTVHIEVADTSLALISDNATTAGGASLDIFLANGQTSAQYYIQGKEDTTGVIHLTATAPGFSAGVDSVNLVEPKIRITNSITLTQDTLDPPDAFATQVGVANTVNFFGQNVRAGSPGVVVTATVDDPVVAELLTLADTSDVVTVLIPAGTSSSPSSVATGGVAFNGLTPGTVALSVTAPGFAQFSAAIKTITVTSPTASMSALSRVGAGLQSSGHSLVLSASGHGGVTVRVESLEPQLALVSDQVSNPGQPFIDVFVPGGSTNFTFYIHGVDDTTGTATVTATAPQFTSDVDSIDVETPGIELVSVPASIDAVDPPNAFYARVGLTNGDDSDVNVTQSRRAGASPLVVTFVSSNAAVAELVTTAESNDTVTVNIPAGQNNSPTSVGAGGSAIDGLASGQTVLTASIPGFITTGNAQKSVNVSNQNVFINGLAMRLGKDLQSVAASAELGESNHGGTVVRVEVDDTTRAVISANALVAGGPFIDVSLSNGETEALFYLQAVDTGAVNVTATAATFATAMQGVDIVPAGIQIINLADSMATSDPDDEFVVQVGAVNSDSTGIEEPQALRGGGPARTFMVASSDPTLAFIVLGNTLDAAVSVVLDPGEFETPSPVTSGGLALTPWNVGTLTVTASTPGFFTTAAGMHDVVLTGTPTGIADGATPMRFALDQNIPNPFNPTTTIQFAVPSASRVELVVYNVAGQRIATLLDREVAAGRTTVKWSGLNDNGRGVASGVYFYRLRAGAHVETRKMVLLK